MPGKAGLKAGLIGAAAMLVLTLLGLIPLAMLKCVCCGADLLAYAGIGVLAGFFLTPPRTAGTGAGAGAIAGLISGAAAGLINIVVGAIRVATRGPVGSIPAIDPEVLRQFREYGVDPREFARFTQGWSGVGIGGSLCCLGSLAIGAALGAIGGAIFAAVKAE
jgi:hypothetical protein